VKPDLDRLLYALRDTPTEHPRLPDLERLLWQRLERAPPFSRGLGLKIRLAAVLVAFLWGVLAGAQGSSSSPSIAGLLLDPPELLAPFVQDDAG
jgi:hypothetical protein